MAEGIVQVDARASQRNLHVKAKAFHRQAERQADPSTNRFRQRSQEFCEPIFSARLWGLFCSPCGSTDRARGTHGGIFQDISAVHVPLASPLSVRMLPLVPCVACSRNSRFGQLLQTPHAVLVPLEEECRKFPIILLSLLRKAFFAGLRLNDIEALKPRSLGSTAVKYFVG